VDRHLSTGELDESHRGESLTINRRHVQLLREDLRTPVGSEFEEWTRLTAASAEKIEQEKNVAVSQAIKSVAVSKAWLSSSVSQHLYIRTFVFRTIALSRHQQPTAESSQT